MVFWPGLPVGEAVRRWAGVGSERCSSFMRPSGRRGGSESEAGVVPPWPGLSVGDWIVLLAYRFRFLDRPMSCVFVRNVGADVVTPVSTGGQPASAALGHGYGYG